MKDGPYLYFAENEKYLQVDIDDKGIVHRKFINAKSASITCYVDNEDQDSFSFNIRQDRNAIIEPPSHIPEKLIVVSDIEGNFNALQGILLANGVINKDCDWIYGKGQLLLCGDMVDRGKNVIPVLWLIYKLESQAQEQGGHVYFLLGNHEEFFLSSNTKYVHIKYRSVALAISDNKDAKKAYKEIHADPFVLRDWLLQKDSIVKIRNVLFVHAGISKELIEKRMEIAQINSLIKMGMPKTPVRPVSLIPKIKFLFSSKGPLWYRGLVMDYKVKYKKVVEEDVDRILDYFKVDHIVVGHSMVEEVSSDFNRKVFRIDVGHPVKKSTGKAQCLLIEKGNFYRVNDLGEKVLL